MDKIVRYSDYAALGSKTYRIDELVQALRDIEENARNMQASQDFNTSRSLRLSNNLRDLLSKTISGLSA